jgi:hypothetical protein
MKYTWPILLIMFIWMSLAVTFKGCKPDDSDNDCDSCGPVVYKPNIYIYPNETKQLTIEIGFPKGGHVIQSEPVYNSGWNIMVDTNGLIDNQYHYLFYESIQPDVWQKNKGWVIEKDNLLTFFNENMAEYGFNNIEIKDFTDYWIPLLKNKPRYAIYPQTIDIIEKAILLNVSEKPENLLRLFYFIEGLDQPAQLKAPLTPKPTEHHGFTITEWGVITE